MYGFDLNKEGKLKEYFEFYQNEVFPKIKEIPEVTQQDFWYHGLETHTENVVIRWIFFALAMDKNPYPVIFACAWHDLARVDDHHDELHWPRAVFIVTKLMDMFGNLLTEDEKEKVRWAVKNHTIWALAPDYISACLWDADRCRLSWEKTFHEKYFNTEIWKEIASHDVHQFAWFVAECLWNDYKANLVIHNIEELRVKNIIPVEYQDDEDDWWLGPRTFSFDDYYFFLNSSEISVFKSQEERDSYCEGKNITPYKKDLLVTALNKEKDRFWNWTVFEDNNKIYYIFEDTNRGNSVSLVKAEIIKADFKFDYKWEKTLTDEDNEKCYYNCNRKIWALDHWQFR